jgi:hypothetical protein
MALVSFAPSSHFRKRLLKKGKRQPGLTAAFFLTKERMYRSIVQFESQAAAHREGTKMSCQIGKTGKEWNRNTQGE